MSLCNKKGVCVYVLSRWAGPESPLSPDPWSFAGLQSRIMLARQGSFSKNLTINKAKICEISSALSESLVGFSYGCCRTVPIAINMQNIDHIEWRTQHIKLFKGSHCVNGTIKVKLGVNILKFNNRLISYLNHFTSHTPLRRWPLPILRENENEENAIFFKIFIDILP